MTFKDDIEAYQQCNPDHRWIFNKLEVAKRLGHDANPISVPIPYDGFWCIRPIINLEGMGAHAYIERYHEGQIVIDHPSHFWHQYFTGSHVSVDFHKGDVVNACYGIREFDSPSKQTNLWKWTAWKKVDPDEYEEYCITEDFLNRFTRTFSEILKTYDYINVEIIGGNIVEIHLRPDPHLELWEDHTTLIPEWTDVTYDRVKMVSNGFEFVESYDDAGGYLLTSRTGFWIK